MFRYTFHFRTKIQRHALEFGEGRLFIAVTGVMA
jgi:hypothetical protein